ncbi:MAG: phosphotriesterase-related protein [Chloroflexota bacterium]|nr:phosphotriesterase-related protein [Chloroflexota bacterium]
MAPYVHTVSGAVPADSIGFTLPHEHTACQLWHVANRWDYWELTTDEDLIAAELAEFTGRGGTCLVDLTLPGIGRDPARLRRLSERSALAIVMGTGWYRAPYYPPEALIDRRSPDELAAQMVREFREGVDATGVRPGIIGEIGVDKPWLSALEERVHRAAARAARATGMAITTHSVLSDVGLAQLRVFEEEGVDPGRVVVGHADSRPSLGYYLAVIERGASVQFDFLGMRFTAIEEHGEPRVIELLCELLDRGHADRVLLSQDVCHNAQLKVYGGRGYSYLAETFLPRLRVAGVAEDEIEQMTVRNPRRILSIG